MKKVIKEYTQLVLKVHLSEDNTSIIDSYRIKNYSDMKKFLVSLRNDVSDKYAINKRSLISMISEWRVHNLLYSFGIEKDRTRTVDLNMGQPWYIQFLYFILSPLYLHFL